MDLKLFISYAMEECSLFNVPALADSLEMFPTVDRSFYCETGVEGDFVEYMNTNLEECDGMILLCTPNSKSSKFVRMEYQAALAMDKPVIPVFIDVEFIPGILRSRNGLKWDIYHFQENITKLKSVLENVFKFRNTSKLVEERQREQSSKISIEFTEDGKQICPYCKKALASLKRHIGRCAFLPSVEAIKDVRESVDDAVRSEFLVEFTDDGKQICPFCKKTFASVPRHVLRCKYRLNVNDEVVEAVIEAFRKHSAVYEDNDVDICPNCASPEVYVGGLGEAESVFTTAHKYECYNCRWKWYVGESKDLKL